MARETGLGRLLRRAFGRDEDALPVAASSPAAGPGPPERSYQRPEASSPRPLPAESAAGVAASRPPDPSPDPPIDFDRLSDDPWERRAAELEFQLARQTRRVLEMQGEIEQRDARFREALLRLREAEEAAGLQAQIALLPAEDLGPGGQAPVRSSLLARAEAEKLQSERRERELKTQLQRAREEGRRLDEALRERTARLTETRAELDRARAELSNIHVRLQALDEVVSVRDREGQATLDRLAEERALIEERTGKEVEARRRLEQKLADAEQQAELYRKNLFKAEDAIRGKDAELARAAASREQIVTTATALKKKLEEAEARLRAIEASARERERTEARRVEELTRRIGVAEAHATEAEREAARLRLEGEAARAEGKAAAEQLAALAAERLAAVQEADRSAAALKARELEGRGKDERLQALAARASELESRLATRTRALEQELEAARSAAAAAQAELAPRLAALELLDQLRWEQSALLEQRRLALARALEQATLAPASPAPAPEPAPAPAAPTSALRRLFRL